MRVACRFAAFLAVLVSAATICAADPLPRPGWIGLRAPNFYVIGDVGQRDLREVARRLEQFREAIGVIFPKAILTTSTPTTVLVFKNQKSYEPMKPLYNGKIREDVAGLFQPGRSMNFVTFTIADGIDRIDIVYHEYVHLVVNNSTQNTPLWFNEGLAEFYRTFEITNGGRHAALGKVQPNHVLLLREHFLPIADLVRVDHQSPLYNESARSSIFYAESWALVHYLLLGHDQKLLPHAGRFVALLANGVPFDAACRQELGMDGNTLQKELRGYVDSELFRLVNVNFTERIGKIDDLPIAPVSEAEVHALLGEVLHNMQRPAEAHAELERALALDASNASAHTSLGVMSARDRQWDEARKQLELAVASPSATYVSYYEYAFALAQSWANPAPGDGEKIENALRRAIDLNPSFPDAYALLAWRLSQKDDGADEGLKLIAKAIELAPGREEYVVRAASLLANKQEFARARALLEQVLKSGSDEDARRDAQQILGNITEFERRKAAYESSRPAPTSSGGPSAGSAPPNSASGTPRFIPVLRTMKPGESRMFGKLTAIECAHGLVIVIRTADGVVLRVRATRFDQIEFISYREDLRGQVQCGTRASADPVLVTFVPDAGDGTAGRVVAVEFVPVDFSP
jgi:tetratricopeptide (TPR) repeat protein